MTKKGLRHVWHVSSPGKFSFFSLLTFLPIDCCYGIIATQQCQNRAQDTPDTSWALVTFFFVSLFFITPFNLEPTQDPHVKHDQVKNGPRDVDIDISWAVGFFFPTYFNQFCSFMLTWVHLKKVCYLLHFGLCFILLKPHLCTFCTLGYFWIFIPWFLKINIKK